LPFIELLAYAVKDLVVDMVHAPNVTLDKAVKLTYIEGYGFQVGEKADPRGSDVVVLLGGLAMPTSGLTAEAVLKVTEEISKEGGVVIGVDFMSVFDRSSWTNKIPFKYLVDSYCESKVEELS